MKRLHFYFFLLLLWLPFLSATAQQTLKGIILDEDNLEPIGFAPIQFTESKIGKIGNYDGSFELHLPKQQNANDTLKISYIGYEPFLLQLPQSDTIINYPSLRILLKKAVIKNEVFITSKFTKSFLLWRKVVRNKWRNDYNKTPFYTYEFHNRLQLSINNVEPEKFKNSKLLKSFHFLLKNTDSSEFGKVTLPFFITETISNIFYQQKPYQKREEVKAILSSGINNESILKLLGGSYQNLNFYDNQIAFFNKEFISPFSDNADNYYKFKILDTQYVKQQRLIHFLFVPKQFADNVFEGDCWIRDSIYGIQKINLRLSENANINFVHKANFMEEFQIVDDTTYFPKKISFVAEISPTENSKINFLVRKNSTFQEVNFSASLIEKKIGENKNTEEVVFLENAREKNKDFWDTSRHESLTKSEILAHATIDTLWKMPVFLSILNGLRLLQSGYLDVGKFRVGKWWSLFGRNPYNGPRIKLELSNNRKFSKNFNFHTLLTLSAHHEPITGGIQLKYIFNHEDWSEVNFLFSNNIDVGFYDNKAELSYNDNIFLNILHRPSAHFVIHKIEQEHISYKKRFSNGLDILLEANHQAFTPIVRTDKSGVIDYLDRRTSLLLDTKNESINTNFKIGLEYTHLTKWLENNFENFFLSSKYPRLELNYTKGISGVLGSQFDYQKIDFQFQQTIKKEPFGKFHILLQAGKYFGKLPYIILERPFANLTMYELNNLFNTVKPFEYIADEYATLHFAHHLGSGIFRFIPFLKKLKLRQIWMLNAMVGSLSNDNKIFNYTKQAVRSLSLENEPLVEIGTSIDNILNLFRVSYYWRLSPNDAFNKPPNTFLFSFHLQL